MTDIAQPGARARDTPARIVVEAIGGCIIAAVQPVAGCETVIFERRAPVRIALVALPVAPVLAIFLAHIAQVAALFADGAAVRSVGCRVGREGGKSVGRGSHR